MALRPWYYSHWTDLRATMLTQVNDHFGVYWGFGTGEKGRKYTIDPSLKIGFIAIQPLSKDSAISISATTILGGSLREKACVADYGQIGGVQRVNCRLAASPMPPSETLDHLVDLKPGDRVNVVLRYTIQF